MIGYPEDSHFYKEEIKGSLYERGLLDKEELCPPWYTNLIEGIFAELYGFAGLSPWAYDMNKKYEKSSSAKIIGDKLYCLIDGKSVLQPQRIKWERREKLKRTLLMAAPKERLEYGFHEIYMINGIRITIYSGSRTKEGQDVMVFRKYIMDMPTFEDLADLGTIPYEAIPLFKRMISKGYNMIFSGQVRSGKTTFLRSWQSYEDISLEGLAISTDPETPWHQLMPEAPIMELVADGKELEKLTKSILRGDNDYILLEEMRDATAYNLALEITSTGTKRSKVTIHDKNPANIPYKMAAKIKEAYGGSLEDLMRQVVMNFDFAFGFVQDEDNRNHKILNTIYRFYYDEKRKEAVKELMCSYNYKRKIWDWVKGEKGPLLDEIISREND